MACHLRVASEGRPLRPARGQARHRPGIRWHGAAAPAGRPGPGAGAAANRPDDRRSRGVPDRPGEPGGARRPAAGGDESLLRTILENGPLAIRACLEAVDTGLDIGMDEALLLEANLFGLLSGTADMREGTAAFGEKRKPPSAGSSGSDVSPNPGLHFGPSPGYFSTMPGKVVWGAPVALLVGCEERERLVFGTQCRRTTKAPSATSTRPRGTRRCWRGCLRNRWPERGRERGGHALRRARGRRPELLAARRRGPGHAPLRDHPSTQGLRGRTITVASTAWMWSATGPSSPSASRRRSSSATSALDGPGFGIWPTSTRAAAARGGASGRQRAGQDQLPGGGLLPGALPVLSWGARSGSRAVRWPGVPRGGRGRGRGRCGTRSHVATWHRGSPQADRCSTSAESERVSDAVGHWLAVVFLPADLGLASGPAAERRHYLDRLLSLADRGYLRALAGTGRRWPSGTARCGKGGPSWPGRSTGRSPRRARRWWRRAALGSAPARAGSPPSSSAWGRRGGNAGLPGVAEAGRAWRVDPALAGRPGRPTARPVHTTVGPHRDDLTLRIGGRLLREFGSTGQQRAPRSRSS